jgi:hypothetical protein
LFGALELPAEFGVETIAQAQKLDWMERPFGAALFHLDLARRITKFGPVHFECRKKNTKDVDCNFLIAI